MHTQSAIVRQMADDLADLRQRLDLRDEEIRRLRRQLHDMTIQAGKAQSEVHVLRQRQRPSHYYDAQGDY